MRAKLLSRMARGTDLWSGYKEVTGNTPDISEWFDFEFYDLVWWIDHPNKPDVTDEMRRLARWIGVSHRVGSDMCYWLITDSGQIVLKTSVEHATRDDYLQVSTMKKIEVFDEKVDKRLGDSNFTIKGDKSLYLEDIDVDDDNAGVTGGVTPTDEEYGDMLIDERPKDDEEEAIDHYLNMEIIMGIGTESKRWGRVVKRSCGIDGETIGRASTNPLFDTREYNIEFTDSITLSSQMEPWRSILLISLPKTRMHRLTTKEICSLSSLKSQTTKDGWHSNTSIRRHGDKCEWH
jgi:hypothetical protein